MSDKKRISGGFHVTLDGLDYSGKSTQLDLLEKKLGRDYSVLRTHEPGDTPLAQNLRACLLDSKKYGGMSPETEVLLFETARRDNYDRIILPAREGGRLILGDRTFDATTAYQGYGLGVNLDMINYLNMIASCDCPPDLSIFIDVSPVQVVNRMSEEREKDNIESRNLAFHNKVRQGYLEIAKQNPKRCRVVRYREGDIQGMHEEIYDLVCKGIENKSGSPPKK